MDDLTGRTLRGYEIRDKLGEGGNGAIYKAYQTEVGRDVVIKVILPRYADKPEFAERFETEAKLVAQLEHPHIVPLHDYWRDENGAFLVMRWLRGGSLRDALDDNPQWLLSKTSHLLDQITSALDLAHSMNVIHRDIKPENILLDERGNAYLTDFGIAKDLTSDSNLTAADAIVGTAAYFAPEQIQSQPVSPATDIYSLGMMVYEMLAGEHAYGELSPVTLVMKHLEEPLPPLSDYRTDIPSAIQEVLEKATAKDASDRYLSAPAFAADFKQAIREDKPPVVQKPPSVEGVATGYGYRVQRQTQAQRNRERMLEKVQDFWIDGVLVNSLHSDTLMTLGMAYDNQAVERPWDMVLQQPDKTDQNLPEGIRITDVYYEMRGELLILGDPGSGKTTTLLELARDLILMAQMDATEPIPVIFNLSSWADNRKPLPAWMVDELHTKYQIPTKIAQDWVDKNQILPLLDGLDEVEQAHRNACVETINTFREENGLLPMVVCSRIADYQALSHRLKLQGAVTLQPLTQSQVNTYLENTGDDLDTVRAILDEDDKLRRLVTSPLMLNIVTLAYRGYDLDEIPSFDTLAGRRKHLFDTYVDRVLKRRGDDDRYETDKTKAHLTWLAGQMSDRAQSVYHIENMQPDWLGSRWKRIQYAVGARVLAVGMSILFFTVFYFVTAMLLSLASGSFRIGTESIGMMQLFGFGASSIVASLIVGTVVGGVLGSIMMTIAFFFRRKIRPVEALRWSWKRAMVGALVLGISFAIVSGTFFNFMSTFSYMLDTTPLVTPIQYNLNDDFSEYESVTLTRFDGTVVELPFTGFNSPEMQEITSVDNVLYANRFFDTWANQILDFLPSYLLIGLLTGAISGAVIGGLTGKAIDLKTQPNQGIRQSLKNFVRVGGAYSALTLITFSGSMILLLPSDLLTAIVTDRGLGWPGIVLIIGVLAPTIGMLVAFSRGGYAVVQHSVLRFLLWRDKSAPRNIARFMDYTSEHLLTRKVGGGYIFIHRMLLEHFAHSEKEKRQISEDTLDDYEPLTYRLEDKPILPATDQSLHEDESDERKQQHQ